MTRPLVLAVVLVLGGCKSGPPILEHHLTGKESSLVDFRGKVVLVNAWAEWCRPCLLEIPHLANLAAEYGGRVLFVALYYESKTKHGPLLRRWLDGKPKYFVNTVAWGNAAMREKFPAPGLPTTFVLTKAGRVLRSFRGAILGERVAELRAVVDEALALPETLESNRATGGSTSSTRRLVHPQPR